MISLLESNWGWDVRLISMLGKDIFVGCAVLC